MARQRTGDEARAAQQKWLDALRRLLPRRRHPNDPPPPLAARHRRDTYCYLGEHRAIALTHRGHKIYLDTRDLGLTPHIALSGIWEKDVEDALQRLLKPRMHVVEVGANMGFHTLTMAQAILPSGKLHCFEANPDVLPLLRATLLVNGFADHVTVHGEAAADQVGEVEFAADPLHIGSGHLLCVATGESYSRRSVVPCTTLDKALGESLGRIDLLRMDAEGSEPQVLKGAEGLIARSPRLRIVTEWNPAMMAARTDVAGLVAWLDGLGFRFWRIGREGRLDPVPSRHLTALSHCELVISRSNLD